MKNTPPSAQTEKDLEHLREMIWFGMTGLSMIQIKQEHIKAIMSVISQSIDKAVASERTRLLSLESMKMEPETYIEPCENCGGEGYGRAWTGHGRATGSAFGDRYEPTHSFVFCKECAPQFTIGKDWMGEEIWKRTSDREEHAQIRINSITHVSKEAKARNLLRQSILSEMEKGK